MKQKSLLIGLLFYVNAITGFAQVGGGTYTVGTGGSYTTLTSALNDINSNGISGNVVLELLDGFAEDDIPSIGIYGGNTSFTLTIRPVSGASSAAIGTSSNSSAIVLAGAQNIILDGRPGGTGDPMMTITGSSSGSAIQIDGFCSNLTFIGLNINYANKGISTISAASGPDNVVIDGCEFSTPAVTVPVALTGVSMDHSNTTSFEVRNSTFNDPLLTAPSETSAYRAILARSEIKVNNNFIVVGSATASALLGIQLIGGGGEVHHNTIVFEGSTTADPANDVYPLLLNPASTLDIANNIIYQNRACDGNCDKAVVAHDTDNGGSVTFRNNNITLIPDGISNAFFYKKDDVEDGLGDWIKTSQGTPEFTDLANADLTLTGNSLTDDASFRSTLITTITTDKFGTSRDGTLPSKGAFEAPIVNTANSVIDYEAPNVTSASLSQISTFGFINVTISGAPSNSINITPSNIVVSSGASISPMSGVTIDLIEDTDNFMNFNYTVTAGDGTSTRDWFLQATAENRWPGGTYSVGTGGAFPNLKSAHKSLDVYGIDGDVILELEDGYAAGGWDAIVNSAISIPGANPLTDDYTITIRPEVGATSITVQDISLTGPGNLIIDGRPGGVGDPVLTMDNIQVNNPTHATTFQYVNFSMRAASAHAVRVSNGLGSLVVDHCTFTSQEQRTGALAIVDVTGVKESTISNNTFFGIDHASSLAVNAIMVRGSNVDAVQIYNNSITLQPKNSGNYSAIRLDSDFAGEANIYHNTINIQDDVISAGGAFFGVIAENDPSALRVKSNIISITSETASKRAGIFWLDNTGIRDVDHNNVSGLDPIRFTDGDNITTTETAFLSLAPNSTTEFPLFTDSQNGDLSLASSSATNFELRTVFDAGVSTDINNQPRGTTLLTKGAYEEPNNITEIFDFDFSGASDLVITPGFGLITVDAAAATDIRDLSPSVVIAPGASVSPISGSSRDFTSSVTYTVTAEEGNQQVWTVNVSLINEAPTDLDISPNEIGENNQVGDLIGTFSTTDINVIDTHTYSLVSGVGDDDNSFFTLNGNQLLAAQTFNFETRSSYSIRVQTDDGNGGTYSEELSISIIDINDLPVVTNPLSDVSFDEGFVSSEVALGGVFTDEDGDALDLTASSSDGSVVTVSVSGTSISVTEIGVGTAIITVTANDGNSGTVTDEFTVTVEETTDPTPPVVSGIDDQVLAGISVYPNPTSDRIHIDIPEGEWQLQIFEPSGRMMDLKSIIKGSIDFTVSNWPTGIYYLRLFNSDHFITTRVLIER